MKVKVISRSAGDYIRETKNDIHKRKCWAKCKQTGKLIDLYLFCLEYRNYDPSLHPFAVNREYQRAVNAVKLDRIFAKPYIGSLDGHSDSVQKLAKHPQKLGVLFSGACNGEIKAWNLTNHHCMRTIKAHDGIVRSICIPDHGKYFFSVDDNQNIKQWDLSFLEDSVMEMDVEMQMRLQYTDETPMNTIVTRNPVYYMDNHRNKPYLITCGQGVDLWEENRTQPLKSWQWGNDTINHIRFNPIESDIAVAAATDRSIILYDIRKPEPVRKVVLALRSNAICWNPMEAFVFTVANEDYQ